MKAAKAHVDWMESVLTLEVQPTIHNDGNVAIKVQLEVSSILKQITVPIGNGGTTLAYEIGTRNTNTLLELKDGETQVLAGLINDEDRRTANKVPGLGNMPVLGRLFSSSNRRTRCPAKVSESNMEISCMVRFMLRLLS